jgi:hypothetical protein
MPGRVRNPAGCGLIGAMHRPGHRPRTLAALAVAAILLTTGCADGGNSGDDEEDFADLSGQEIADAAEEDMRALDSMRYAGSLTTGGTEISLDIQASVDGDCTGTIDLAGGSVEVLSTGGQNWFRADEEFWRANAPDDADQIIAAVGDSWVVDSGGEFSQFCDLDQFRDSLFDESDGETTYTNKGADEIDGEPVVEVESKDAKGTSTGFVLVEGDHYLVRIASDDADGAGEVVFSDFDAEVGVEAPADDEVVDLDELD